jgi:hypothetical protein
MRNFLELGVILFYSCIIFFTANVIVGGMDDDMNNRIIHEIVNEPANDIALQNEVFFALQNDPVLRDEVFFALRNDPV